MIPTEGWCAVTTVMKLESESEMDKLNGKMETKFLE